MMELRDIQKAVHAQLLNIRNLDRLVSSLEFEEAYTGASLGKRNIVKRFIADSYLSGVEKWIAIQKRDSMDYEALPVKQLRVLAQGLGILGYHYLPKTSLLSEIKNAHTQETRSSP
jgi:hypothetical protein